MKIFLSIILLFVCLNSWATNYYVAASGNDANSGLSGFPWRTVAKVNSATFASGDVVYFNRGDVFYGGLVVNRNNISFDAYGSGALPVITGLKTLTSWTNLNNGVYKINLPNANIVKIVTINGQQQRMGRWPDYDPTTGGWATYSAVNSSTPSITDATLKVDWTGATIAMKAYSYVINLCPIVSQATGGVMTYSYAQGVFGQVTSPGIPGYGYFITNDLRTLTTFGEWYFNSSTKDLYVYFGGNNPASYNVQASDVDIIFDCGLDGKMSGPNSTAHTNVSVSNLSFEGGNKTGFNASDGSNITVTNCVANNCWNGFFTWYTNTCTITGCTATNILNDGISQFGLTLTNPTTGTNNTIRNVGMFEGMGDSGEGDTYTAFIANGQNVTVSGNSIDTVGFNGIHWQGSHVLVQNNIVNHGNMKLDDGGEIYTYDEKNQTDRTVRNNILINGIGNKQGRSDKDNRAWGLYNDGGSSVVTYLNNSVAYQNAGCFLNNSGQYISIMGNTFYSAPYGIYYARFPNTISVPGQLIRNSHISQNINYPSYNGSNFFYWNGQLYNPVVTTIQADIQAMGTWDSSYYRDVASIAAPFDWFYHEYPDSIFVDPSSQTLTQWKAYSLQDSHSSVLPTATPLFLYNATGSSASQSFSGSVYSDAYGTQYTNSATIPAWSSKLLFYVGSSTATTPTANAGVDQSITLPSNYVFLQGSALGTAPYSYTWTKISGLTGDVILNNRSDSTTITFTTAGTYLYRLGVTDATTLTGYDTVQITVNPNPTSSIPPTVYAGTDQTIQLPTSAVNLTMTYTGNLSDAEWHFLSGPSVLSTTFSINATYTGLIQGVYSFEAYVKDFNGLTARDTIQVTVLAAAVVTGPSCASISNVSKTLPFTSTVLIGVATANTYPISTYLWSQTGGASTSIAGSATTTATITGITVSGKYVYQFKATDNHGNFCTSSVTITALDATCNCIITKNGRKKVAQ